MGHTLQRNPPRLAMLLIRSELIGIGRKLLKLDGRCDILGLAALAHVFLETAASIPIAINLTVVGLGNIAVSREPHLEVLTEPGDEQGCTLVERDQHANVTAYLTPKVDEIRHRVVRTLGLA